MKTKILLIIILINTINLYSKWTIYNHLNSPIKEWILQGGINQDKYGNFWFYQQQRGLERYDGEHWLNSENISERFGIAVQFLPSACDTFGNMWFGIGGGLLKYDGNDFSLVTGYTSILPKDLGGVWQVLVDKKNTIWLTTGGKGVLHFDINQNKVTEYNRQNSPLTTNSVHDVVIDNSGNFWFICGTQGLPLDPRDTMSLVKFDGSNWTVYTKYNSGYGIDVPFNLAIDSIGNIWIGGYSNLQKFDGKNWTLYGDVIHKYCKKIDFEVLDLDVDKKNNLWVMIAYGICGIFKYDGKNWTHIHKDNSDFPATEATCAYIDHDNKVWIGTQDGGIAVFEEDTLDVFEPEIINKGFSIKPNPAEDKIKLGLRSFVTNDVKISISNYMGNTVKEFSLNAGDLQAAYEAELDVSDLPSGIYFATVRSGGQVQTEKFVVVR